MQDSAAHCQWVCSYNALEHRVAANWFTIQLLSDGPPLTLIPGESERNLGHQWHPPGDLVVPAATALAAAAAATAQRSKLMLLLLLLLLL